jgi:primosomal protein N' (replication factor Y) (superfamily II helicase)
VSGGPAPAQVYPLVEARALDRTLDYAVPPAIDAAAVPGALAACPLGPRTILGVIVGRDAATHEGRLVPLRGLVDAPAVPPGLLDLAAWMGRYYLAPAWACLRLVLPFGAEGALRKSADGGWRLSAPPAPSAPRLVAFAPGEGGTARQEAVLGVLREAGGELAAAELVRQAGTTMPTLRRMAEAGLLRLEGRSADRSGLDWFGTEAPVRDAPHVLTPHQAEAVSRIEVLLEKGAGSLLLHGVTGSGKTEIYLRALENTLSRGRTGLVLVPEIALTPQLLSRVRARFGERVAVWHSALAPGERIAEDRRIRAGGADVVLGARSAVFAPLPRLGLVIVDEEHDASYKQDQTPRYDARQVAFWRARQEGAVVVYGSATPRPESWKALERVTLPERADGARLPPVEIVDMCVQPPGPISRPLAAALMQAADRGEKAILLLNRRGFAKTALCRHCGWFARCPDCDVAMVVHRPPEVLVCHHCGHTASVPEVCPSCHTVGVMRQGSGTEGLEEALQALLPEVRLVRLDASSVSGRGSLTRLLDDFARPGAAVLLGTQMVAKGHDLPEITVAGVLDADGALQRADFRSEERAFSLIVQLAGRAGRRVGEPARVIVQAWQPDARAIVLGARHAVEEFLEGELERRIERGFPPFGHLVRVMFDGDSLDAVKEGAASVRTEIEARSREVSILGPAPQHRLRGRHRRSLLVRADRSALAAQPVAAALDACIGSLTAAGVRASVDVDPQDT